MWFARFSARMWCISLSLPLLVPPCEQQVSEPFLVRLCPCRIALRISILATSITILFHKECPWHWAFTIKRGPAPYCIFFLQIFDQFIKSTCMYRVVLSTLIQYHQVMSIRVFFMAFPDPFFISINIDHLVLSFSIPGWFPWCKFILQLRSWVVFRAAAWVVWNWPGCIIYIRRQIYIKQLSVVKISILLTL